MDDLQVSTGWIAGSNLAEEVFKLAKFESVHGPHLGELLLISLQLRESQFRNSICKSAEDSSLYKICDPLTRCLYLWSKSLRI